MGVIWLCATLFNLLELPKEHERKTWKDRVLSGGMSATAADGGPIWCSGSLSPVPPVILHGHCLSSRTSTQSCISKDRSKNNVIRSCIVRNQKKCLILRFSVI